jgi:hypothetical protein
VLLLLLPAAADIPRPANAGCFAAAAAMQLLCSCSSDLYFLPARLMAWLLVGLSSMLRRVFSAALRHSASFLELSLQSSWSTGDGGGGSSELQHTGSNAPARSAWFQV